MESRFSRQSDLIPQETLAQTPVTVIGVGAVGRQAALQLASIGVSHIQLIDFDHVEPTNITTQGYLNEDLGKLKVEATAEAITRIDPTIKVEVVADRYRPKLTTHPVVFCCVDKISVREAIWKNLSCALWLDARMLGENIRVLAASNSRERDHYQGTLFSQQEAQAGRCTAKSTIYTANISSALMVHQFSRWLRNIPLDADISLSLLASEMVC